MSGRIDPTRPISVQLPSSTPMYIQDALRRQEKQLDDLRKRAAQENFWSEEEIRGAVLARIDRIREDLASHGWDVLDRGYSETEHANGSKTITFNVEIRLRPETGGES